MTDRRLLRERRTQVAPVAEDRRQAERRCGYLSVKEYAAYRGVHVDTVMRWIKEGRVPGEQIVPHGRWWVKVEPGTAA